jgi:hypothetical protein
MEFLIKLIHPLQSVQELMGFIYLYFESHGEFDFNFLNEIFQRHFTTVLSFDTIRAIVSKFNYFSNNAFSNFVQTFKKIKLEIENREMIIYPPLDNCSKCLSKLQYLSDKTILVYYYDGPKMVKCVQTECNQCQIKFNVNNFEKSITKEYFLYDNNIKVNFIKISNKTIFETKLLIYLDEHICRNGMKFDGFSDSYNCVNESSFKKNIRKLDRRRLSEAWFTFKIKQFLLEINDTSDILDFESKHTEEFLKLNFDKLKQFFIEKWSKIHKTECDSKNCHQTSKNDLCIKFSPIFFYLILFLLEKIKLISQEMSKNILKYDEC